MLGLFARRPEGLEVSDSSCASRVLATPDHRVLASAMRVLELDETLLPLATDPRPLHTLPEFTVEEALHAETRRCDLRPSSHDLP